jgi:hypothetical protein
MFRGIGILYRFPQWLAKRELIRTSGLKAIVGSLA